MKKEGSSIWLIILLVIALVLSNLISKFSFDLFDTAIVASVFTFPFVYFSINRLTQTKGLKTSLFAILMAIFVQAIIFAGTHYLTDTTIKVVDVTASLISFLTSAVLATFLYNGLVKGKTKNNFVKILLIYVVVLAIDNFLFLVIANKGISNDFGLVYGISVIIKIIIGSLLTLVEVNINKKK